MSGSVPLQTTLSSHTGPDPKGPNKALVSEIAMSDLKVVEQISVNITPGPHVMTQRCQ